MNYGFGFASGRLWVRNRQLAILCLYGERETREKFSTLLGDNLRSLFQLLDNDKEQSS